MVGDALSFFFSKKALYHALRANHLRDTDMMQSWLAPIRSYDIAIDILNSLGFPERALRIAEVYLSRKGLTETDRKNIYAARKKCYRKDHLTPWSRIVLSSRTIFKAALH